MRAADRERGAGLAADGRVEGEQSLVGLERGVLQIQLGVDGARIEVGRAVHGERARDRKLSVEFEGHRALRRPGHVTRGCAKAPECGLSRGRRPLLDEIWARR